MKENYQVVKYFIMQHIRIFFK